MPVDIRLYKQELRDKYKTLRRDMPAAQKQAKDMRILRRVCSLEPYQKAKQVFVYVSTLIEVDTIRLMELAWKAGKKVAVPRCIDGTRLMDFYYIEGMEDLAPRTFGVLEPGDDPKRKVTDFSSGIAIVPGLSFDHFGYRLGYGKGYYDRFLSRYEGPKVGICYQDCTQRKLPHGRFDVPVNWMVTERGIYRPLREENRWQKKGAPTRRWEPQAKRRRGLHPAK